MATWECQAMNRRKKGKKWFVLQLLFFKESHFWDILNTSSKSPSFTPVDSYSTWSSLIHCHFFTMLILGNVFPHNYLLGDAKSFRWHKLTNYSVDYHVFIVTGYSYTLQSLQSIHPQLSTSTYSSTSSWCFTLTCRCHSQWRQAAF